MKEIKFNILVSDYKIKYKKSVLFPKKFELVKITLDGKEFTPNQKIITTEDARISVADIYNKSLFTEKNGKGKNE